MVVMVCTGGENFIICLSRRIGVNRGGNGLFLSTKLWTKGIKEVK